MIRSRLNVLLAERDFRQDQIFSDTGISKVTISNIVNNKTNVLSMKRSMNYQSI